MKTGRVCQRQEYAYRDDAVDVFLRQFKDSLPALPIPVFITRNPVDRVWSAFRYFKDSEHDDFKKFLLSWSEANYGHHNPIVGCNYKKYIEPFKDYNPLVLRLEDLQKNPNFPKDNVTPRFYPMEKWQKEMIEKLLELEYAGKFHKNGKPTQEARDIVFGS